MVFRALAACVVMLYLVACGGPPEQAKQGYWLCWSTDTVLYSQYGPQPHHPSNGNGDEPCLDSQLMAAGFVRDPASAATGGWRKK